MQHHPSLKKWLKCVCGYSKIEKPIITMEDYYMGRDVEYASELTADMHKNATNTVDRVNALLQELGITEKSVNSGWRPTKINKKVGGGKKSAHLTCEAIDLEDKDRTLTTILSKRLDLLEKYGLWMENPSYTKSWCHLQTRPARSGRIFRPY